MMCTKIDDTQTINNIMFTIEISNNLIHDTVVERKR